MSASQRPPGAALALPFLLGVSTLAGCGSRPLSAEVPTPTTTEPPLRGRLRGTTPVDTAALAASAWRYVEGTCTEGILDMSVRGFSEVLAVHEVPGGVLFEADRHFEVDGCAQTVRLAAQRTDALSAPAGWAFTELARVSYPDSPRCERAPQEDVPGEVRMRGPRLELFVRRSSWCGGYEARLVYEQIAPPSNVDAQRTLRHFVAAFHDRDSLALAMLYAPSGYHDDPHRPDEAGRPTRHSGHAGVQAYFASVFHQVPWLALRLREVHEAEASDAEGVLRLQAEVEYMDPRMMAPRPGTLDLELVDGRIFASWLQLAAAPAAAPSAPTDP